MDGGGSGALACIACKSHREQEEEDTGIPCCDEDTEEEDKPCKLAKYLSPCINPRPVLRPSVSPVWSLWERTQGGGFTRYISGMTVIPVGKIRADVIAEATAMGIPWDDFTSRWYGMIENAWLVDLERKRPK